MQHEKSDQIPPFYVLLVAAGTASRYGRSDRPKQYDMLCGKPVLRHSLDFYLNLVPSENIRIVINKDHQTLFRDTVHDLNLHSPVSGGESRKQSVYNGLHAYHDLPDDAVIMVHDAARPFISRADINDLLTALESVSSATLGTPIPETLRRVGADNILTDKLDRTDVWALQTPQAFHYRKLLDAHEQFAQDEDFTDDCGVMEAAGHSTKVVRRHSPNIKITWPEDLAKAGQMMMQQNITVTGQGFDVHAFTHEPANHIRLGGIDVPSERALTAHSDGDVVLHALTDALFGALGEGDIGLHFPPSDPQWKGKDSAYFLEFALDHMNAAKANLVHCDLTIICEAPKIGPVRDKMRARIAALLDLSEAQVNIKATTTEGLGFTGRKEGIAAQALVTLMRKASI